MTITDMTARPSGRRWAVALGLLGAVWYGFGLVQMGLGVTLDTKAAVAAGAMTAEHATAVDGTPALIWLAFALASGAGLVGAVLLVLGKPAYGVFCTSLSAAAVYYLWVYGLSGTGAARPVEEAIIGSVVVTVTLGFTVFARRLRKG